MAYVRSLREIPLTEEPHASVLAALALDATESPFQENIDWANISVYQLNHLRQCPECVKALGPALGQVCFTSQCSIADGASR